MTDAQIAAYIMLLSRQWLCKDCKLPEDIETLSKYAMHDAKSPEMQMVLDRFPVQPDGGRANEKLLDLYKMQSAKYLKRKKAADKRWMHDALHDTMQMHGASGSASASVSSIQEGVKGEDSQPPILLDEKEGPPSIPKVVDAIISARPIFKTVLHRMMIENELRTYKPTGAVLKAINAFIMAAANSTTDPDNGFLMLRGFLRNAEKYN